MNITQEDIGRKVRLRDGEIVEIIDVYDLKKGLYNVKCSNREIYINNGLSHRHKIQKKDIVEFED